MSKDKAAINLDAILKELGPFRKYNIINYALLLFPCFLAGMYGSVFVFEALDIDYRCRINECEDTSNDTSWLSNAIPKKRNEYSKCSRYAFSENFTSLHTNDTYCDAASFNKSIEEKCTSFVYNGDSVVKDFDLGCISVKRTLVGTIHNSGLFVALPLTGIISDRFGRRIAISCAALMNSIFGVLRSFSVNYYMLVTFEFLEAALGAGAYTTAFVLAMELVSPKGRVFGNTLINIVFVFGLMTLSGLSWTLQDWRKLLRIIYAPSCLVFSYLFILNESVRWLLSKGRYEEALVILKRAAKINKVELTDQVLAQLNNPEKESSEDGNKSNQGNEDINGKTNAKEPSIFIKVIKSSILRKRVATCSFLWMTCTFVYYGLSINSVSLAGNIYVNFMLVSFIEIPGNICCLYVADRFGRKRVLMIAYTISAILCISLSFIPADFGVLSLIVYLSGKFSITVAYSTVYVYVSELFPTNVRQSLLAICSCFGRVGSTMAPLTPLLALYWKNLPSIFFGTLAIIAGLFVFTLPETLNQRLPDSIEEAERLSKEKSNRLLIG